MEENEMTKKFRLPDYTWTDDVGSFTSMRF
jgi:hypothetical protein